MQRDRLLLAEIVDAVERLTELTATRTSADFDADRDRRDALLWNFTVLGEAVSQLSAAVKDAHPEVSWSHPVRLRHRIVHGYWSVDPRKTGPPIGPRGRWIGPDLRVW